MEMALAPIETPFGATGERVLDYPALVMLLAAHQRAMPTARAAARLPDESRRSGAIDALIALFGGRSHCGFDLGASVLAGRFNPSVPISDTASTQWKAF